MHVLCAHRSADVFVSSVSKTGRSVLLQSQSPDTILVPVMIAEGGIFLV